MGKDVGFMRQAKNMTLRRRLTFDQVNRISRRIDSYQDLRIYFYQGKITVNAKSFLSVSWFFLNLQPGDSFTLAIEGPQAKEIPNQLMALFLPFIYPLHLKKSRPLEIHPVEMETQKNEVVKNL